MKIEVNGRTIEAREGEMLLAALRRVGLKVPTLCHIEGLFPSGACRMCVVEVEGQRGLAPSCAFPVCEGMKVKTHSPRVMRARKMIVELLLADHPDDCLYCVRNGTCELQALAADLGVRERRIRGARKVQPVDASSPSIVRDPDKCVLCGRCVRVCEEVQGVSAIDFVGRGSDARIGTAFEEGLNVSSCVNCGQCVTACPTGALRERSAIKEVLAAINDPERTVVVQHAPAVSVSLAEEFGMAPGDDICGAMTTAMRTLGFDRVFETSFSADVTIMEEAAELVERVRSGGTLPMFTSCSPGWIKFVEQYYPDFMPNLSTCKSPQQMLGAIIKSYFAEKQQLAPESIFSVAVMPCTAKKFEAERPEMARNGVPDVDAVLTTRELARMMRLQGVVPSGLTSTPADTPFGQRSTAGKLFGTTGGVMEAAVRTAHYMLTGSELGHLEVKAVRGLDGVKEARVMIDGLEVGVAVASGLGNARRLLDEIRAGRDDLHFVEVMTCPGGCINGGGQPLGADLDAIRARMRALYQIDRRETVRTSHSNPAVRRLYDEFLTERRHNLLHTRYAAREVVK